jgi:hypothetical protein
MESQNAGFPAFPLRLEIPSGFPHSQRIDGGIDIQKQKRNRFIRARFNARDL